MGDWTQPLQKISTEIVNASIYNNTQENTYYIACKMILELRTHIKEMLDFIYSKESGILDPSKLESWEVRAKKMIGEG